MKRFLVFAYYEYDNHGGLGDVIQVFDTLQEANGFVVEKTIQGDYKGFEVLDTQTGIITEYYRKEFTVIKYNISDLIRRKND